MAEDGGRKVSLVCSSRANPPVQSYVWFRIKDSIRVVGNQSVLVTGEDGEYFCSAANEHGSQNSSAVTVKIKGEFGEGGGFRAARRCLKVVGSVPTRPLSLDLFAPHLSGGFSFLPQSNRLRLACGCEPEGDGLVQAQNIGNLLVAPGMWQPWKQLCALPYPSSVSAINPCSSD